MLELKLFICEHKPERVMAWRDRKSEGMVKREKRRLNMLSDDMSFGFSEFLDFSVLCACHCQLPQKWQQLSLHILLSFNFLTECIRQIFSWNEFVRGTILVYCLLKIILRLIWEFFLLWLRMNFLIIIFTSIYLSMMLYLPSTLSIVLLLRREKSMFCGLLAHEP